jgi:hypothetical protein
MSKRIEKAKKAEKRDKRYAKASRKYTLALDTYDLATCLELSEEVRSACYREVTSASLAVCKLYDKYYL